ncbi:MAG: hypothetical protein AB7T07_03925 [Steroidobacteraceae bacterium]
MCTSDSHCSITRIADGGGHELRLAQLQEVMQHIQISLRNPPSLAAF